jgi:hypothetical protein
VLPTQFGKEPGDLSLFVHLKPVWPSEARQASKILFILLSYQDFFHGAKVLSILFRDFQLAGITFFFNSKLKTVPERGFGSGTK